MTNYADITPSPRILRALGEIPFQPWQCIAELVDNSLDAFRKMELDDEQEQRIVITWSSKNVPPKMRQIEIVDTGPGMTLDQLRNTARAGYSSNNPMDNLGLFGMGFNIATARLGDKTTVLSTTAGTDKWVGIEIDFAKLDAESSFSVPIVRQPKRDSNQSGTRVIISDLNEGIFDQINSKKSQVAKILSDIYAPILKKSSVELMIPGHIIKPFEYCVWGDGRYVHKQKMGDVKAYMAIDVELGNSLFNFAKNRYLTPEEQDSYHISEYEYPNEVVERKKKITGWLGVQRYSDVEHYGIDLVRNGRKILRKDKSLFNYINELTGSTVLEYPKELGTTVGGRIVGEIHVDHVPVTYQKNDFDRLSREWFEVVENLRDSGPVLPKQRKTMGYDGDNDSPIGIMIRAYQQNRPGTNNLTATHKVAKGYAQKYYAGDPDYYSDQKWYDVAREVERSKDSKTKNEVDQGVQSSDDVSAYLPNQQGSVYSPPVDTDNRSGIVQVAEEPVPDPETVEHARLVSHAIELKSESGEFTYDGNSNPLNVKVWQTDKYPIQYQGKRVPCKLVKKGKNCDFFFDPSHALLKDYTLSFRELLILELAESFRVRDASFLKKQSIQSLFSQMFPLAYQELRIDQAQIREKANALFDRLREGSLEVLRLREIDVIDCIHESNGEVEEVAGKLIMSNSELMSLFQDRRSGAIEVLSIVPSRTIVRLIERFPEEYFDGKVFKQIYKGLALPDSKMTERLQSEIKERILSYMKDALWSISESAFAPSEKVELIRCAQSIEFLEKELVN